MPGRVKCNTYANDIAARPLAIYGRAIQDVPLEPARIPSKCVSLVGGASMVARMENGDFDQRGNT